MKSNSALSCVVVTSSVVLLSCSLVYGADPVIHAQWDDGGPSEQPEEDIHYRVRTVPPASPDFPDVELIAGRLDWRIWSTDSDNPNGIGDIGVISCPHPQNYAVAILDPGGSFGARDVKAIRLVPTSASNYSNVRDNPEFPGYGSWISGQLIQELVVQADTSGVGGEVSLNVKTVTADMTVHKLNYLGTDGFSGTIDVDELAGNIDIGLLSGNVDIATTSAGALIRVFTFPWGSLTVSEIASNDFGQYFPNGVGADAELTYGDFVGQGPWPLRFGFSPGERRHVRRTSKLRA